MRPQTMMFGYDYGLPKKEMSHYSQKRINRGSKTDIAKQNYLSKKMLIRSQSRNSSKSDSNQSIKQFIQSKEFLNTSNKKINFPLNFNHQNPNQKSGSTSFTETHRVKTEKKKNSETYKVVEKSKSKKNSFLHFQKDSDSDEYQEADNLFTEFGGYSKTQKSTPITKSPVKKLYQTFRIQKQNDKFFKPSINPINLLNNQQIKNEKVQPPTLHSAISKQRDYSVGRPVSSVKSKTSQNLPNNTNKKILKAVNVPQKNITTNYQNNGLKTEFQDLKLPFTTYNLKNKFHQGNLLRNKEKLYTQNNFYNSKKIIPAKKSRTSIDSKNNYSELRQEMKKKADLDFEIFDKFVAVDKETGRVRSLNMYVIGKILGKGSYAVVRLGLLKEDGKKVAIKTYEKTKLRDETRRKNVRREIEILMRADHPNIIKIIEVFHTDKQIHLVLEYVGNESLYSYMKMRPKKYFDEEEAKKIFKEVITAVAYCHENFIIHRDIKLENILIDSNKKIRLIDFGFSISADLNQKLTLYCGTPSYFSPEIVMKKEYFGGPSDTWACGILLYKMISGRYPFVGEDDKALYKEICKCDLKFPNHFSDGAKNLLSQILVLDPLLRLTAAQAKSHYWLNS